jgi:spore coat polysaccharide biosynthesis protein SpsF (cytidylyltransferase family)
VSVRPVAIIQARMGSARLPGKVLADVAGAPLLARMVERLRGARSLAAIVVATPRGPADAPLRELTRHLGLQCFAGSEHDVLGRYIGAAARAGADPIVRLTADCPLIDPAVVDACVARFLAEPLDYVGLGGPFPDGLDTEVIAAAALVRADAEARLPSEREHVTPYLKTHPETFRCATVEFPEPLDHRRWTVDEPRDLDFVRAVYRRLYRPGRLFGWREVEALLAREPGLARLNAGIERNAGYRRSLARDGVRGPC